MQKKITVMALAAIVALVLAMPVAAQVTYDDVGTLSSNTKTSTATIFTNDVDNFINYHKYSTVLADGAKWFGFVTGRTTAGGVADLGFATNIGSLYLGIWYRGNIVRQTSNDTEIHTITPTWNDTLEVLEQSTETTQYTASKWLESANKFEFLVGVAGHGIKVGFFESYALDQNPASVGSILVTDYQDGVKDYTRATIEYQNSQGHLKPYIGWGSNFAIAGMNLMPYVDFAFDIYSESRVDNYENYTEVNGVKQDTATNTYDGWNSGRLIPDVTVGAKLDFAKKNTTVSQLELKYNLSLDVYDNDYSASGFSGSVPGTVTWNGSYEEVTKYSNYTRTSSSTTLDINEDTRLDNTITLGYKITGEPFENFKLGFLAQIPVSFGSASYNHYTKTLTKTVDKYWDTPGSVTETEYTDYDPYNTNREISTFGLALNFGLGASYKLKPDRFIINAGISAMPLSYTRTETTRTANSVDTIYTEKVTQDDGTVTTNEKYVNLTPVTTEDSVRVTDTWTQWTATLRGGFVFYFSPKAALDLVMSATMGPNSFNLDLSQINVIFTFKF